MNDEPQYFVRNKHKSALFENQPVLTLREVCWMNPNSIFENITIPSIGQVAASVFVCHMYPEGYDFPDGRWKTWFYPDCHSGDDAAKCVNETEVLYKKR